MADRSSRVPGSYPYAYNAPSLEPPTMYKTRRADSVEQTTSAVDSLYISEQQRIELQARAILAKLPKESLYTQRDLSSWRMDIPGLPNSNDKDPSFQGLDLGEFDPPAHKPPPKSILKPASSSMRPSPKMTYTYEQRKAMKAAVVDEHRPGYLPGQGQRRPMSSTKQPIQQPAQSDTRGGYDANNTINPAWATIKGPSQYLQKITAARAAKAPANGGQGRAEDAIYSARVQGATAAAARGDTRQAVGQSSDHRRRHIENPVPNPPPDRFLADNGAAIPRGAYPRDNGQDIDPTLVRWTIKLCLEMADDNREKEKAEEAERKRLKDEKSGGRILAFRPGRYWGNKSGAETQLFAQSDYGYTPEYGRLRQPGDDPKMRGAEKNTAYTEAWYLRGHSTANKRRSSTHSDAAPDPPYRGRPDDRDSSYNNYTTLNPDNLSHGISSMRGHGNTASMPPMPTQQFEGLKRKAQMPPPA